MDISNESLIWFPNNDLYTGRDDLDYTQIVKGLSLEQMIELVQARAIEDGEYCIANGMVGPNNENAQKMQRMMAFVGDPKNIEQAVDYIYKEQTEDTRTVDFVCRDLAKASKWAVSVTKS